MNHTLNAPQGLVLQSLMHFPIPVVAHSPYLLLDMIEVYIHYSSPGSWHWCCPLSTLKVLDLELHQCTLIITLGLVVLIILALQWNPSKAHPWNEYISLNQDTVHGPSYIEMCTKLPLKWGQFRLSRIERFHCKTISTHTLFILGACVMSHT